MKKKMIITATLLSILLFSISVYAAGRVRENVGVDIPTRTDNQFNKMSLTNFDHDRSYDDDFYYIHIWAEQSNGKKFNFGRENKIPRWRCTEWSDFNAEAGETPTCLTKYFYTTTEMNSTIRQTIKAKLEESADVFIQRDNINQRTEDGGGTIVLTRR